jgi:hypothetical protein
VAACVLFAATATATATAAAAADDDDIAARCLRGERVLDGVRRPQLRGSPPPLQMPVDMAAAYTRCGALRLARMYVDDTFNGNGSHYVFPAAEMARHVSAAEAWVGARWRRRCRVAPLFSWSSAAVALRSESRAGDAQVRASSDGTQGAVDSREARDSLWLHLAHVCVCACVCVCVCVWHARIPCVIGIHALRPPAVSSLSAWLWVRPTSRLWSTMRSRTSTSA